MPSTSDTISVLCACGKKLKAPATAIGRRAKCPSCANVLTIEAPPPPKPQIAEPQIAEPQITEPEVTDDDGFGAMYDLAATEKAAANSNQLDDSPRCPKCAASMQPGAVLCTTCGFDSRSNKRTNAAAAPKPAPLDYGRPKKKKPVDRMAPQGSFMLGLLLSFGLGIAGGIVWFLITWISGLNFYIVCVLVGGCAGAGMKIGQKGFSSAGGWAAAGVTAIVMIGARLAIIIALLIPIIERAAAAKRSLTSTPPAAASNNTTSAQPASNGNGNSSNVSTSSSSSSSPTAKPHPNLSAALGTLVIFLLFPSILSTLFMLGSCWVAYRTAAGSVG